MKVEALLNSYSNSGTWGFHKDKNRINEIAKQFNLAAEKELIMQADESVRDQYVLVYKKCKDTFGESELEEMRAIQSISDTIEKNKSGSDNWWAQ